MGEVAVRVEGLGKRYGIGARLQRHDTLRDQLADLVCGPLRRLRSRAGRNPTPNHERADHIWALKDVSFDVRPGEVVGIIGRNGAGKSTLLKILSRITAPTEGRAEVHGRVASLLEVGTGFNPELTGRENVYLNGAILGMKKAEIDRKFDEILAFAEVERFVDTPVKRYSSGMYVRLAFGVAAHLEPEILLVDEVLAVGDAAFQKKCLGKMGDVARGGRTVLFVSHNIAAVAGLCDRGLVLESGGLIFDGDVGEAVRCYLSRIDQMHKSLPLHRRKDRQGDGTLRFTDAAFRSPGREATSALITGEVATVVLCYEGSGHRALQNVSIAVAFYNHMGQSVFVCSTRATGEDFERLPPRGRVVVTIPRLPLREGRYYLNIHCEVNGILADWVREAASTDVVEGDFFGTGVGLPRGHGLVMVDHRFGCEALETRGAV